MRIQDLFENKIDGFVEYKDGKPELKFDLAEDLVYFMNHDDESYRRHLYPVIALCLKKSKNNDSFSPAIFKKATMECYKNYLKQKNGTYRHRLCVWDETFELIGLSYLSINSMFDVW